MRTDHVFYRLFKDYPETLFDLLGEVPTSPYVMSAVQVKELAFSFDGVLVPENGEGTIYFLEVQFYDDPAFYPRLFGEVFLHLSERYRGAKKSDGGTLQEVRIVVLYPERRGEAQLWTSLHRDQLSLPSVQLIYLDELAQTDNIYTELVRLVVAAPGVAPEQAQRLMSLGASGSVLDILENIMVNKFPRMSRQEIQTMLGLTDTALRETQFYKDVAAENESRVIAETTLKMGVKMLRAGQSLRQVAELTELPIETLRAALLQAQEEEN